MTHLLAHYGLLGCVRESGGEPLQYDKDIASVAERLRPLGQEWLDEFASSYLALNDKQYLPEIEQKIVAAAKVGVEKKERERLRLEEEAKAYAQEQDRLAQERKKRHEFWADRLWGNRKRKIQTIATCGGMLLLVLIAGGVLVRREAEQRKVARTEMFIVAADHDDWVVVRELVEQGVDVNAKGKNGNTALLKAVSSKCGDKACLDAVNTLLEHGANVNVGDKFGYMPLHNARNPAIVSLLLRHGAAVDARDPDGMTPLLTVICMSPEIAIQLIQNHADVTVVKTAGDGAGTTPLHQAAGCGDLAVVRALVEHGAPVNGTDRRGQTPLALTRHRPEISAYLKAQGATGEDPNTVAARSLEINCKVVTLPSDNSSLVSPYNGGCKDGVADGHGSYTLSVYRAGVPKLLNVNGEFRNGSLNGKVTFTGVFSGEGEYRENEPVNAILREVSPNGRIEVSEWRNGLFFARCTSDGQFERNCTDRAKLLGAH